MHSDNCILTKPSLSTPVRPASARPCRHHCAHERSYRCNPPHDKGHGPGECYSGTRKLLGAPSLATRDKKLLGTPGIATSSILTASNKNCSRSKGHRYERSKDATRGSPVCQSLFSRRFHLSASVFLACSMGGRTRAQTCTRPDALSMAPTLHSDKLSCCASHDFYLLVLLAVLFVQVMLTNSSDTCFADLMVSIFVHVCNK